MVTGNENTTHYDENIQSDTLCKKLKERKICWLKTLWSTNNKPDNRNIILAFILKILEHQNNR